MATIYEEIATMYLRLAIEGVSNRVCIRVSTSLLVRELNICGKEKDEDVVFELLMSYEANNLSFLVFDNGHGWCRQENSHEFNILVSKEVFGHSRWCLEWELQDYSIGILQCFRLSYHHLPSYEVMPCTQCFAYCAMCNKLICYCAMFSKDFKLDKVVLVLL